VSSRASSAVNATVTGGAVKTASSQQSGSARIASNAVVFFTRIQTCNLSGRASSRASATVTPSLQAQAQFGGRASMASSRSIAFIIKAQFQSSARLSDTSTGPVPDCECPPWQIDPAPPCGWIINPVECPSNEASLPFTLPVFRLYELGAVVSGGGYSRVDDITCTISGGREADLPFTLPIFRLHAISYLISGGGYHRIDDILCSTTRDGTLVNAFGRRGCE
jgi:hypothetical protein